MFGGIETVLDYKNNSLCFVTKESNQFYLNLIFLKNMKGNQHLLLQNILIEYSYDLKAFDKDKVLINLYNRDRSKMNFYESKKLIPKPILCHIKDNNISFEELPVDTDNPRMIASAIGKNFIIYYDYSQIDEFSYRLYNLDSHTFTEKYNLKINDVSDFEDDFKFNNEKNIFIASNSRPGDDDKFFVFELFKSDVKVIPVDNN